MFIVCCDLEGVFVPEIWINVAEKTGIESLRLTTRDIPDYDELMQRRLRILNENKLTIHDIQNVISNMSPLPGAFQFLDWLRAETQVIIVSDTFVQFAGPLMEKLNRPTLMCNTLEIDLTGVITGYHLRQQDGKKHVAAALKSLNYDVIAMGDSYNDISMLKEANIGFLFRPPEKITLEFPEFKVFHDYDALQKTLKDILK